MGQHLSGQANKSNKMIKCILIQDEVGGERVHQNALYGLLNIQTRYLTLPWDVITFLVLLSNFFPVCEEINTGLCR